MTNTIAVLLLSYGLAGSLMAQDVESDYEIQKNFKQEVKQINQRIESATTVDEARQLVQRVENVKKNFNGHEQLLDKALYPDTYDEVVGDLDSRVTTLHKRLATIDEQRQRLQKLSDRLAGLEGRLESLSNRSDSLRKNLQETTRSEQQLSNTLARYRESLRERDQLILSIIDSVLVAYQGLTSSEVEALESAEGETPMEADGNAIELLQTIAQQNIEFLNNNPQLDAREGVRMYAVQQQFEEMWNRVGDKLVAIYGGSNKDQTRRNVQEVISTWNERISNVLWPNLHEAFAQNNIELSRFTDSRSFFNALNSYLDQGIQTSRENGGQENYTRFQNFSGFWAGTVKANWSDYLLKGEILSSQQMASIDQKVNEWAAIAKPQSNLFVYLLGLSVLIIIVLGVMLVRKNSGNSASSS